MAVRNKAYKNMHASTIAWLQAVIVQARTDGVSTDLQFVDLDSHADVKLLPTTDLLGLFGFTASSEGKVHTVDLAVAVMPLEDTGGFKRRELVDRLYGLLQAEGQVPLVDADTGSRLGYLVATDGTEAAPTARAGARVLQAVHATLKADPYATSR